MQTRCPDCQTVFRVTPEQLKARAGKVRCGQCQSVFNALDSLLGYSKWSEGVMAAPVSLPSEKPTRWPFILVALLLILAYWLDRSYSISAAKSPRRCRACARY
jgi:predicted Zn finger-like uncharacterized protein